MKIALLGHGNMGQEVERLIKEASVHSIVSVQLKDEGDKLNEEELKQADVVIDFTSSEIVVGNIRRVASMGKNMVVGTTGWYESLSEVEKIVKKKGVGLIYAQNFSVGANIFFRMVANAAKLTGKFPGYDVYGLEIHHKGKKDSPSGTALRVGREIIENYPGKKRIQNSALNRQIEPAELHFVSIRAGRNPGFHQVVFDSQADSITLSHAAHGRAGFAQGAILAAEFIKGKSGIHTFDEVFK